MTGRSARQWAEAVLTAAAAWWALLTWEALAELSGRFLVPLLLVAGVSAASGGLLRRTPIPRWLIPFLHAVPVGLATYWLLGSSDGPRDTASAGYALRAAFQTAADYAAPIPAQAPTVAPLLLVSGAVILWMADLIANTARRPALVAVPLIVTALIPAIVARPDGLLGYLMSAGSYLALLAVHRADRVSRWSSTLPEASGALPDDSVTRLAAGAGTGALALSVLLAGLVPVWGLNWGSGSGGGGQQDVTVTNPMTDLQRDLRRGEDRPLLRVRTDDPDPAYLRLAVLTRFRNTTWSAGDRSFSDRQAAQGDIPPPLGTRTVDLGDLHRYDVTVLPKFTSTWLPTPQVLTRIQAPGDWRYDLETLDFLSAANDLTTAGISYRAEARTPRVDPNVLAAAPVTRASGTSRYLLLPSDLPATISDLADTVVAGQPSKFQEAVALQQWFRKDGGFRYSLETATGSGVSALQRFLDADAPGGRVGYCEQFASAMAVMARVRGIPARVAVGFLRPEPIGTDTFEFSSHDLHAWPELYFAGAGWVRFEPTPGAGATAPNYTTQRLPDVQVPSQRPTTNRPLPTRDARPTPPPQQQPEAPTASGPATWALALAATAGILLVVALVAAAPDWWRRRRRRQRIDSGDLERGWHELRDTVLDLGRSWQPGRSPRETGDQLSRWLGDPVRSRQTSGLPATGQGVNPEADASLGRLVTWWESARYSGSDRTPDPSALRAALFDVIAALEAGAPKRARQRARWLPRSLWHASAD